MDKGQTLVRKLGQKVKSEDKKEVKLEEVTEPSKGDHEHSLQLIIREKVHYL